MFEAGKPCGRIAQTNYTSPPKKRSRGKEETFRLFLVVVRHIPMDIISSKWRVEKIAFCCVSLSVMYSPDMRSGSTHVNASYNIPMAGDLFSLYPINDAPMSSTSGYPLIGLPHPRIKAA